MSKKACGMEKTGRNDPCPCGSGKKYKNCCQNKETKKATYTEAGKRKFKASVLSSGDMKQHIFQSAPSSPVTSQKSLSEAFNFKATAHNFQKKPTEKPLDFRQSEEEIQPQTQKAELPPDEFNPTTEDFTKKS